MNMKIYTIGHSTLSIDEFLSSLKTHKIDILVDVRSLPGSNYVPAFNQENLIPVLKQHNMNYIHLSLLGGRRKSVKKEHYKLVEGWKNTSFKNYASYTLTDEYAQGIKELVALAEQSVCCVMCAERVPWKCHRSIIANTLVHLGIQTAHIVDENKLIEHKLNLYGAKSIVRNGQLIYLE